ncbi:MAG: hypothetical protein ACFFA5_04740 [Promethearchaeota archaeon]
MHSLLEKISEILKSTRFQLFVITFFFYIQLITGFHSINEKSRFALILAIVEDQSFIINKYAYLTQYVDISLYNGNYYSDKGPGLAFIGVPFYIIGKFLINQGFLLFEIAFYLIILSAFVTALSIVLIYDTCINIFQISKNASILVGLIYGFGTIALFYSKSFFSHSFAAFLLLLSFYFGMKAIKFNEKTETYFFISGLAMGLLATIEYFPFLVIIPLAIYFVKNNVKKNLIFFMFPIIVVLILHGVYNYICFENPLTPPYYYEQSEDHSTIDYFIQTPIYIGLFGQLFSIYRGLFFYSPILLLTFHGTYRFIKVYRAESILYLTSFAMILSIYSMNEWWGGNCYGPRYILAVIPFITIPISVTIEEYRNNKLFWVLFSILFGLSVFNIFIGTITFSHTAFISQNPIMTSLLLALDGEVDYGLIGNRYIPKIYVVFSVVLVGHDKILNFFKLIFRKEN